MKTEYLNRAVTISRDSLHELMLSMAKEKVGTADSLEGMMQSASYAATLTLVEDALSAELFPDDRAITIRGEDYAVKAHTALRGLVVTICDFKGRHDFTMGLAETVLGEQLTAFFEVEDKLFGSDHVEEHEAVKNEKEDGKDE